MKGVALPLLVLVACTGVEGGHGFAVRDSAGVTIAESTQPVWAQGAGWRVSAEPELEIGVADGDTLYQFVRLVSAGFLSDGRITAADYGASGLKLFRPDGTFERKIGRDGEAPGEFRNVWGVQVAPGDTLVVADSRLRRVTRFDADGRLVDIIAIRMPGAEPMGSVLPLADGRLLVVPSWSSVMLGPDPAIGLHRVPVPLLVYGTDGTLQDTLGMFPGVETEVIRAGARITMGSPTFTRGLAVAMHGDGTWVGTGDDLEARLFTPDGALQRILRVPDADLAVTAADVQGVRDRALARLTAPDQRAFVEQMFANAVVTARRAAYSYFLVDGEGNLWTSPTETVSTPFGPWNVFDRDDRWLGEFEFPEGFRPYDIRDGRVLGRWRDESDVEYLRVYRIEKR